MKPFIPTLAALAAGTVALLTMPAPGAFLVLGLLTILLPTVHHVTGIHSWQHAETFEAAAGVALCLASVVATVLGGVTAGTVLVCVLVGLWALLEICSWVPLFRLRERERRTAAEAFWAEVNARAGRA